MRCLVHSYIIYGSPSFTNYQCKSHINEFKARKIIIIEYIKTSLNLFHNKLADAYIGDWQNDPSNSHGSSLSPGFIRLI